MNKQDEKRAADIAAEHGRVIEHLTQIVRKYDDGKVHEGRWDDEIDGLVGRISYALRVTQDELNGVIAKAREREAALREALDRAYDAMSEIKREAIRPGGALYAMLPGSVLDKMQKFFDHAALSSSPAPKAEPIELGTNHFNSDGNAFSKLRDGKWLNPDDEVFIEWNRLDYKKKYRLVAFPTVGVRSENGK